MKVYLDDVREAPFGWKRAYWPKDTINLLQKHNVTQLSLDHDLGNDKKGTGYDVLLWIEDQVINNGFKPPSITVHSANISARHKMDMAIENINKFYGQSILKTG
ncbi:hypothetical protein A3715_17035 [Oleiphilus sp. HI0009]|nr:hypothetical protein A3715_35585 [Oleiphilus sp. HI0009]KZX85596.1 hypothetical protein A3715_17035 [Oleiphilus sp. HI0009]